MAKYLDYTGLSRVWSKIKEKMTEDNRITLEFIRRERAINGFCTLMKDDTFETSVSIQGYGRGTLTRDMVDATGLSRDNIKRIIIGAECTAIGNYALSQCTSLEALTIGNNVETIGAGAFSNTSIASVVIPASVTSIGGVAFSFAGSGSVVRVYADTPPTITSSTFGIYDLTIYVPAESVNAYKTASGWSSYADYIQAMP